jgi:hypothetical protein
VGTAVATVTKSAYAPEQKLAEQQKKSASVPVSATGAETVFYTTSVKRNNYNVRIKLTDKY